MRPHKKTQTQMPHWYVQEKEPFAYMSLLTRFIHPAYYVWIVNKTYFRNSFENVIYRTIFDLPKHV